MTDMVCIVCPRGCNLKVDEKNDYKVIGHACGRGEDYGRDELMNPMRTVTSTVGLSGAMYRRCPVKTKEPIPKRFIIDAMRLLDNIEISAPVTEGRVVIDDIYGTGIPWVTTREFGIRNSE